MILVLNFLLIDLSALIQIRSRAGPVSTADLVSDQSLETKTRQIRCERFLGAESSRGEEEGARIGSRSERRPTGPRRRRKIHPSVFRGRGAVNQSINQSVTELSSDQVIIISLSLSL